MTLRSRFTMAVASAVAAVALAITAVAFLVVRADLTSQVREQLQQQAAVVERLALHYHGHIPAGWVPQDSDRFGASAAYAQVVTAQGAVWAPAGDIGMLPGTAAAAQVAAGQRDSYYTEATLDGIHAMVLTTPLAPVGRLAAVAEQVTATGDPARRVEVGRADELGRLAASFNTMLGALQRSLAAQRKLVSDASHELRTPLTSLSINAELLAAEPGLPEAERREVLDRVVAQVAELGQLVAGVTELAQGDDPPGSLRRDMAQEEALDGAREVDLAAVVSAALDGARRDWPHAVFTARIEPCTVLGDPERLKIAVRNLLDNAAKFGPPGAPVEVRLHAGELTVRDRGPGIASADLPYVFDRFYRAAAARGVPGSGLGLSIVDEIVRSHGGAVYARNRDGGGAEVGFTLPEARR